jgi:hypothetical protein
MLMLVARPAVAGATPRRPAVRMRTNNEGEAGRRCAMLKTWHGHAGRDGLGRRRAAAGAREVAAKPYGQSTGACEGARDVSATRMGQRGRGRTQGEGGAAHARHGLAELEAVERGQDVGGAVRGGPAGRQLGQGGPRPAHQRRKGHQPVKATRPPRHERETRDEREERRETRERERRNEEKRRKNSESSPQPVCVVVCGSVCVCV